jgi:hypothetical protein
MLIFAAEYESANTPTNTFRSKRFPIMMNETKYNTNAVKQSEEIYDCTFHMQR